VASDQKELATPASPLTHSEQFTFVFFSTWIIAGLFLDGWSHQVRKPETFFTPWHGLMYSGFFGAMVFGAWQDSRARARGETASGMDRLVTIGGALCAVGAGGDCLWHALLGIEVNTEALLSPTHLGLATGGLLLASRPARVAWRTRPRDAARPVATWAVVQSVAATTAVVAFFTQFSSAFRVDRIYDVAFKGMGPLAENHVIRGVTAILLTNALLLGALTFLTSRWTLPRGACTFVLGIVAFASSGLTGFDHVAIVFAAVAGGLAADAALAMDRPKLVPIVAPLVMWSAWTAIAAVIAPFEWSPNVWGGAIFLTTLTGVGLQVLAYPSLSSER
jgi:hypothetical protein